jgi:hypothetical protein
MWHIGLSCDGCDEPFAACPLLLGAPALSDATVEAIVDIAREARRLGWESVVSPDDGEQWFCPTCRLARDGRALDAAAALVE